MTRAAHRERTTKETSVSVTVDVDGPEGKVRGTPQQIIEKYLVLARDAQLGNDRVASENFLQHAEHYIRMLAEAQREMAQQQALRTGGANAGGNGGGQPLRAHARRRPIDGTHSGQVADRIAHDPEGRQ